MTAPHAVLGVAVLASCGLIAAGAHGASTLALTAGLVGNIAIPALWAAVMLVRWPPTAALMAAALTAVVLVPLADARTAAVAAGFMLAGLAGGWALGRAWRVLPIVALAAACLVPVFFIELAGTDIEEAGEALTAENRRVYAESLPEGLSVADREAALAEYDAMAGRMLELQRRLWPSLVIIGLWSQAALALVLGWLVARLVTASPPRPAVRPWETWRAPFFSVWALIGGLALTVTSVETLVMVGWNVVLLAGLLLAIQGLAVQTWLVRRALPPLTRVLFWIVGALFLGPLLLGVGGLVGLVDQWWDLRRTHAGSTSDGE
jgi:hypothetical protein